MDLWEWRRKSAVTKSNRLEVMRTMAVGTISLCVMFLMFWHLGVPSVNATDEAYHGVNV